MHGERDTDQLGARMSRDNDEGRKTDRTPASDRRPGDEAAPEAEAQDGSLKVHGDKYEPALDDSPRRAKQDE